MHTTQPRPDVVASQVRSLRVALNVAKEAVREWGRKDVDRDELASGMLLLLDQANGDNRGERTQQVVSDFFEEHVLHLERLALRDKTSLKLAHAIGRLGVEGRILNQLVRSDAEVVLVCIICERPNDAHRFHDDGVCFDCRDPHVQPGEQR